MLVSIGMMVASYCIARLLLVPLTQPGSGPQTRGGSIAVSVVVVLGCLGVGYCEWALLGKATQLDERPRMLVR